MSTYVLDIDSNIPLPKNAEEAMPPMTAKEELEVRARTIKLISDLQGKEINPTENDKDQAREHQHDAKKGTNESINEFHGR